MGCVTASLGGRVRTAIYQSVLVGAERVRASPHTHALALRAGEAPIANSFLESLLHVSVSQRPIVVKTVVLEAAP